MRYTATVQVAESVVMTKMAGGNIVVLQRILGQSDIRVTMRYAHFAPDHLEEAISNNPLPRMARMNGGRGSYRG